MTHVRGSLVWSEGIFIRAEKTEDQLVLYLGDGSDRRMNLENWDETAQVTESKLRDLKRERPIKFATWESYDPKRWFCDVEPIENPEPSWFLSRLSNAWITKRDNTGGFQFSKGYYLPEIRCSLIYKKYFPLGENRHKVFFYRIVLRPADPFFSTFRPYLYHGMASPFNNDPEVWLGEQTSDIDQVPRDIADKWRSLEIFDFVKFLESKWYKSNQVGEKS